MIQSITSEAKEDSCTEPAKRSAATRYHITSNWPRTRNTDEWKTTSDGNQSLSNDPIAGFNRAQGPEKFDIIEWPAIEEALAFIEANYAGGITAAAKSKQIASIEKKIAKLKNELLELLPPEQFETRHPQSNATINKAEAFTDHWRNLATWTSEITDDMLLARRAEFTGTDAVFKGYALPGTAEGDDEWMIMKCTYATAGACESATFAGGGIFFGYSCTSRGSHTYSQSTYSPGSCAPGGCCDCAGFHVLPPGRVCYPHGPGRTSPSSEAMPRSSDCKAYRQCLDRAALLDIPLQCPCPNYQRKPEPASWRDVYACELLLLAVTWPEAFEVFQAIRQAGDRREKWAVLRAAVPRLGLRKKDMLPPVRPKVRSRHLGAEVALFFDKLSKSQVFRIPISV